MGLYRTGQRTNPAMVSVAQSLDDIQIRALAAYFGSLAKSGSNAVAIPGKAKRAKR
jgi:cytochrome c553